MNDAANCMHRQFTESQSYCPDCGLSRSEVLMAACEPYLKDEETPAECIARNRRDVDGCLTMLVAEKIKTEALQARLADPCRTYDRDGNLLTVCHSLADAEARRDAARYRWLRATGCEESEIARRCSLFEATYDADLDAAIDAAMAESSPQDP